MKMPIHVHLLVSTCIYSTWTFLLWWLSDDSKLLERRDFSYFALPFACNFGYTSSCSAVNDLQSDFTSSIYWECIIINRVCLIQNPPANPISDLYSSANLLMMGTTIRWEMGTLSLNDVVNHFIHLDPVRLLSLPPTISSFSFVVPSAYLRILLVASRWGYCGAAMYVLTQLTA
jgi:hypothetical protein